MSDEHSLKSSDEDDEFENGLQNGPYELQGRLSKWTNYIHGWQERFVVLKDGTLSYYKSENDTSYGCRGAISLHRASIKLPEFDECRIDVSVKDCVWYLRASSPEEKFRWVEALEASKQLDSAYGSENSLRRHGSALSLGSTSLASVSSFQKARGLREKLAEMETFRDILCRQCDTLQAYFDMCAEMSNHSLTVRNTESHLTSLSSGPHGEPHINPQETLTEVEDELDHLEELKPTSEASPSHGRFKALGPPPVVTKEYLAQHGAHAIDFKGEAITFKATTAGILATLSHCIDLMTQREDSWKRRLEKEIDRRKKVEDMYKQALSEAKEQRTMVMGSPDFEEGPHCMINEDEFFDAIDAALDKNEEQEAEKLQLKNKTKDVSSLSYPVPSATLHPLWPEIDSVTMEQLRYSKMEIGEGGWQLFAEEGEMRMYKREVEEGGVIVDPLKAVHSVKGVTGHEMCHYFFSPEVRFDWETTLEGMKVVEAIAPDTLVFHQVHKRVWPATQRDALFWSHIRHVPNTDDRDAHDIWIVCNHSMDHPSVPATAKFVRITMTVCLMCQTFVDPPMDGQEITRDNLTCRITYCSTVNPGGWAPASVLRAVYKREYPKFLKRFTQYVKDQTVNKEIMF